MARIVRKRLDHKAHFAGRFGAIYFITICCQRRGSNQLCHDETAAVLVNTARIYHEQARWNLNLLLLMPGHLLALIGIDGQTSLAQLIRENHCQDRGRKMATELLRSSPSPRRKFS
jgi:REP element-mobilizing transposase RayT